MIIHTVGFMAHSTACANSNGGGGGIGTAHVQSGQRGFHAVRVQRGLGC